MLLDAAVRPLRARTSIARSITFDSDYYQSTYRDVGLRGLPPFEHYLRIGRGERRRTSPEFNPIPAYAAASRYQPGEDLGNCLQLGDLAQGDKNVGRDELIAASNRIRASGLFDEPFYRRQCAILADNQVDTIEHYVSTGYRMYLEPSPLLNMRAYLAEHPDVRNAGMNPLLHYIDCGYAERRVANRPSQEARWCPPAGESALPDDDIHLERMAATAFFSRFAFDQDAKTSGAYLSDAVNWLASQAPNLTITQDSPDVSIVIPVYGQTHFVLGCLDSLARHSSRYRVEVIIVDDASAAESESWRLEAIPWMSYRRRAKNGGFLDACNDGAAMARGRYVVLLNSDTNVVAGWLDELIGSFDLFPNAAMIGSKLFNQDGSLQEAGGIYWHDGEASNYGRDDDPNHPKYCFARRVDYCSAAAIAVPSDIWKKVGGFDAAYRPAYCEDADLAFRLRDLGYEVWFQPLARVLHHEGRTHGTDVSQGVKSFQIANMKVLAERWRHVLASHRAAGFAPSRRRRARPRGRSVGAATNSGP